jgi:cellulose synthase/poly-beta-1,6-N-acetylglucosamine synthase-like glycosyltransferase
MSSIPPGLQTLALLVTVGSMLMAGVGLAFTWVIHASVNRGSIIHRIRPDRMFIIFFILAEVFYLVHKVIVLNSLHLNPYNIFIALILICSEILTLTACTHSIIDVLLALNTPKSTTQYHVSPARLPFVSIHVPICAEPPSLVIETLEALDRLDYPNYEVIVISNNTTSTHIWKPIKAKCEQLGFYFYHFDTLKGYKAGALNVALLRTSSRSELVGIVDADNVSRPDFLMRTVGLFENPGVAFVQTRQDYRDYQARPFWRGIYPLYRFFYDIVMVARHVRGSLVFCGSMGLVRTRLLKEIGGWDEWCITEDADASLRLLALGYQGFYINESYGFGILPPSFREMKSQWFRWMVGAAQIIRKHHLYNLFSKKKQSLSMIQRWDYLLGGSMSFGSLLMMTSILFLSFAVMLMIFFPQRYIVIFASLSTSIAIFSFFIIMTGMSSILAFKVKMGFPWRDAIYAFCALMALGYTRGLAFLQAFTQQRIPFRRTSKIQSVSGIAAGITGVKEECMAGVLALILGWILLHISPPQLFPYGLLIMLGWQVLSYFSAVVISVQSLR